MPLWLFTSLNTGLDFGGFFLIKQSLLQKVITKRYITLSVCMATKALHLELISDMRADTFLVAIKRFIRCGGLCNQIFCNHETTFVLTLIDKLNRNKRKMETEII